MDKLDNYKINELVLKVVNKEISVDDVLNTHYETEDYKQAYENRFATYPRFTGKGNFEKYL